MINSPLIPNTNHSSHLTYSPSILESSNLLIESSTLSPAKRTMLKRLHSAFKSSQMSIFSNESIDYNDLHLVDGMIRCVSCLVSHAIPLYYIC